MNLKLRLGFLFVLCLLVSSVSWAQPSTGTPTFGSFASTPAGTLNLGNLNLHLSIPIFGRAGRGTNFNFALTYDSSVWYPLTTSGTTTWTPTSAFGWAGGPGLSGGSTYILGNITYSTQRTMGGSCSYDGRKETKITYTYSNFVYVDPLGARHTFGSNAVAIDVYCGGDEDNYSGFKAIAIDSSGYVLDTTGGLPGVVTAASGSILSQSGLYADTNGNEILSANGVFTDTLGTTALSVSGSGTQSSPVLMKYPVPGGAGTATAQVIYSSLPVQTKFGCSGISEYSASVNLVNQVVLADETAYTFTYEYTPGSTTTYTGRVSSVTLPTGGVINIGYTGGSNGIECSDGSTAGMTIQTPDGTTTYARSGSGTAWTTTVTAADSQSSQTVIQFQESSSNNFYETSRLSYQGASTLLRTVNTCYNGDSKAPNCTADAIISLPILSRAVYTGLPSLSGKVSLKNFAYNAYGLLTGESDYDYGAGAPGSLLRSESITYASLTNGIVNRPQTISIFDGSGNLAAQTNYTYDGGSVVATSGTPNHISVSGSRGNATTVSRWVSSSLSLSSTYTYLDTGLVQTAKDVNSGTTTFTYGACGNSFPTSTQGATGMTVQETWNCNGGVPVTLTDANNNTVTASYTDPYFWRPASLNDALNNATAYTYTGATSVESVLTFNSNKSAVDTLATLDLQGRSLVQQVRQGPGSSSFDGVSYAYDSEGRRETTTLPYTGSAGSTNSGGSGTTTAYDALNRKSTVTDSGGAVKSYTYTQNDKLVTLSPKTSGEKVKQRQYEYDGLGRLTSVCEVTSTLAGNGTCGQTNSLTGYWTKYTYNAVGKIIGVVQNAQSSGSSQTRAYSYDGLGRLISETNPETKNAAVKYVYDTDSTCGTSYGDLVKKTDAMGNVTCNTYDALHRLTQITYPSGAYAANTPAKYFVYDSATVNGTAMSNAKGHLAEAYTGSSSSKITDLGLSYSVRGENSDVYEMTPHSGGYFHVNAAYWANGVQNTLTAALGATSLFPTITYGVDGEGRTYSASASSGQNPLISTSYNPASRVTALNYGSLDSDAFGFDPNTGRPTSYQFQVNGSTVSGLLTWNPNGSLGSLAISNPFNSADTQTCTYTHDDLQRTAGVSCSGTNAWTQTFAYDAFGNISKDGSSSFGAAYSSSTNQISSGIPNVAYDTNGNLTSINSDYPHSYSWDSDGNQVYVDGIQVTFDALDRAVEQLASGSYTQIVYSTAGAKLALVSGGALIKAFVPLPGRASAVYQSSGLAYYRHPDWLGSSRFASTTSRTMYYSGSYAPFGESYSEVGTTDRSFTGQNQDTEIGQYDFLYRNYSSVQGRWISPDRAGWNAVKKGNPQTWNRYAYVMNRPLTDTDPEGMFTCYMTPTLACQGIDLDNDLTGGGGGGGGGGNGGFFNECTPGDYTCQVPQCPDDDPSCGNSACDKNNPDCANDQNDQTGQNDCDQSGNDGTSSGGNSGDNGDNPMVPYLPDDQRFRGRAQASGSGQSSSSNGSKSCSPNNNTPFTSATDQEKLKALQSVSNVAPSWFYTKQFSDRVCNFLKSVGVASLLVGVSNPETAPVTGPAGSVSGIGALVGCSW